MTTYNAFNQYRLGRFLSPDPYGQFYSAYTGMGNNPVNLVDPSGGMIHIPPDYYEHARYEVVGATVRDPNTYLYIYTELFERSLWVDFSGWMSTAPTNRYYGGGGGGNGGSTGPGSGSGGGSGSPNSDSHLSGPPPGPDGEEEETKTVPRGEPNEYKTEALSPAIPIGYQVLKITFATSAALVGTVAVLVVLTSSDTRPPEPLPEPDVVDAVGAVILIEITEAVLDEMSKGGRGDIWPQDYPRPNISEIDWRLSDSELANRVTGGQGTKGPGSKWSKVKKWFRDKRRKLNNKLK